MAQEEIKHHHLWLTIGAVCFALLCTALIACDVAFKEIELTAEHTVLAILILVSIVVPFATKVSFEGLEANFEGNPEGGKSESEAARGQTPAKD